MNCDEIRTLVDNTSERFDPKVAEHLRSCSSCQRWMREMQVMTDAFRRLPQLSPPEGFERRVRLRIQARRQERTDWLQVLRSLLPSSAPEAIASAAFLAAITVTLMYSNLAIAMWVRDGYGSWFASASESFQQLRGDLMQLARPQGIPMDTVMQWLPLRWIVVIGIAGALLIHRMIEQTSRFVRNRR